MAADPTSAAEVWWPYVSQARWFQGKSRDGRPASHQALPWLVDSPGLMVRPELLEVSYDDGSRETYQLLAAYRPASADTSSEATVGVVALDGETYQVSDAPRDPEAMAALLPALTTTAAYAGPGATLVATMVGRLPAGDTQPRVFSGEQSNTNVLLGEVGLLKVFRKLEPGPNLDREVTERLQERGVEDTPKLYGWLAMAAGDDEPTDLMMLSELLSDPVDGWELAVESCRTGGDFTDDAAALGRALGEIHHALSDDSRTVPGDEVADLMAARLRDAVAAAPALAEYEAGLSATFDALRGRELPVQPVHGDFHLGQTLRTADGWRIIDFEGEPLKSMAERRRPDSSWRDVAGMMRSLSYAASNTDGTAGPDASAWVQRTRQAFLRAYGETSGTAVDEAVLAAYEADKAAYEVVYEMRNRPDWVSIPLGAIAELTRADTTGR